MKRITCILIATSSFIFGCLAFPVHTIPPPPDLACTAIGCGYTLQIELVGSLPADFVLRATDQFGETISVHCREGQVVHDAETTNDISPVCGENQVVFLDYSPEKVTISIESDDLNATQSFRPETKEFRPNGPGCEPACRSAKVEFRIPDP